MGWPTGSEYSEAVQNLRLAAGDEELRAGVPLCHAPGSARAGLPMVWSGNFADVYKIDCPESGNSWALKCFTSEIRGQRERYRIIAEHLEQARLSFAVDFRYLEEGVRVGEHWFPALKMRWIEGLTLNRFVEDSLQKPKKLVQLLELWVKLSARLRAAEIAHADLQHGNVLLVPLEDGRLALRLIDYDGMFVPKLSGTVSGELGHPAYQHPQRLRDGTYNGDVDRFSHLVIYCAVHCLAAPVFRALWQLRDDDTRALVGRLALACRQPLAEVPWVDKLVEQGRVQPLSEGQEQEAAALLAEEKTAVGMAPSNSAPPGAAREGAWWLQPPAPPVVGAAVDTRPAAVEGTLPAPAASSDLEGAWQVLPAVVKLPAPEPPPLPARESIRPRLPPRVTGLPRAIGNWLARMAGPEKRRHNVLRLLTATAVLLLLGLSAAMTMPRIVRLLSRPASSPKQLPKKEMARAEALPAPSPDPPVTKGNGKSVAAAKLPAVGGGSLPSKAPASRPAAKTAPIAVAKPLRLRAIPPQSVVAGKELTVALSSEDAELPGHTLQFSLGPQSPPGARVVAETATFTWTPSAEQGPGEYEIALSAASADGRKGQISFKITVTEPLRLPAIPPQTVAAGKTLSVALSAGPAGQWAGPPCFALEPGAPAGAVVDPHTGRFTWTPAENQQAGTYAVGVLVSGGEGQQALMRFNIIVTNQVSEAEKLEELYVFRGHKAAIRCLAFSPDGGQVVTGGDDGRAVVWDTKGRQLRVFALTKKAVHSVAFRPFVAFGATGDQVLAACTDEAVIWDASTGRNLRTFHGRSRPIRFAAFSPDGLQVLVGYDNAAAALYEAASGRQLQPFPPRHFKGAVRSVVYSPDGRQALSLSGPRAGMESVLLLDSAKSEHYVYPKPRSGPVSCVAFSRDGSEAVTGFSNGTAVLWDVAKGKELYAFCGHTAAIVSVALSNDRRHVLTGSADATAIVWDATTGEMLYALKGHGKAVSSVAFSFDGGEILTGSEDQTARLWQLPP
ncbi:MAG: putative Ig domain-containing protein [Thermoguttaceae bacterium]